MLEIVLGDIASWHWLYLAAKPSHVQGGRCGWASMSSYHPTACSHQSRERSFLLGAALFHHATVGSGTFPRGAMPPGLDI
jgi:hypothetical protein